MIICVFHFGKSTNLTRQIAYKRMIVKVIRDSWNFENWILYRRIRNYHKFLNTVGLLQKDEYSLSNKNQEPDGCSKSVKDSGHPVVIMQTVIRELWEKHKSLIIYISCFVIFCLSCWYLVTAMLHEFGTESSHSLLIGSIVSMLFILLNTVLSKYPVNCKCSTSTVWECVAPW